MKNLKHIKTDNVIFLFISVIVIILFLTDPKLGLFIEKVGQEGGPLSPFMAGVFYSISVTSPAATAAIFYLGKVFNPFLIAIVGAFGSALADFLLFKFIKKRANNSVSYLARKFKTNHKTNKIMKLLATIVAGLIIASPLPDELAVVMLGAINFQDKRLFVFSYILNFLGILTISWLGSAL